MSQPLERNFIGEEEDVQQEDVECNLQLDKMKLLQEVHEDLDAESPMWNPYHLFCPAGTWKYSANI